MELAGRRPAAGVETQPRENRMLRGVGSMIALNHTPRTFDADEPGTRHRRDAMHRLTDEKLLARGCVVLIGLDAVCLRLADQWEVKRDAFWQKAEGLLESTLPPPAVWARISDLSFVVCADEDPVVSRAVALKVLRKILEFFLGVQRQADIQISMVVSMNDHGETVCRPLDPEHLERSVAPAPEESARRTLEPRSWIGSPTVAASGGFDLSFVRENVVNLKNCVGIADRLDAHVRNGRTGERLSTAQVAALPFLSQAEIQSATVERAGQAYGRSGVGIFFSASMSVLRADRECERLTDQLRAFRQDPARPIIIELVGVDQQVTSQQLGAVVAELAPHCRKILARIPPDDPPLDLFKQCGLTGLSTDWEGRSSADSFARQFSAIAEAAHKVAPLLFALGLGKELPPAVAQAAGATHAGYRPLYHYVG